MKSSQISGMPTPNVSFFKVTTAFTVTPSVVVKSEVGNVSVQNETTVDNNGVTENKTGGEVKLILAGIPIFVNGSTSTFSNGDKDRSGGFFMGNNNAKVGIQAKETKTVDNKKTGEVSIRAEASTPGSTGFKLGAGFSIIF